MTVFSFFVLIGIIIAFIYINRLDRDMTYQLHHSENKSDIFKDSLIEQKKGLKLSKYSLVGGALVILSLSLIKQILITVIILIITVLLINLSIKRMNYAKLLSRADNQQL